MKLTLWTYEGPPHIGAMRIVASMQDVHYVLHAPQGDTYADLLFTMIQRDGVRPPVTYTTFQARDLGKDTAALFRDAVVASYERFQPTAMVVGASCTAELIQDDPGGLAQAVGLPIPVVPVELPAYQRKENWGAAETLYHLVRTLAGPHAPATKPTRDLPAIARERRLTCNLLGPTSLGFRHRDDVLEITRLLNELSVDVAVVAPLGATPSDVARLGEADFNVVMYPEVAATTARWLGSRFGQPATKSVPYGVAGTLRFAAEVAALTGRDVPASVSAARSRMPWYSQSIDSNYLTGKRVFVFGDAMHAIHAARVARDEFAFDVVGIGTYTREFARDVRALADEFGIEALISDDYLDVEARITELEPELILGTQMERHIAKRLGIACAVISAPIHVQDFPAAYSPQFGFEGANVLFDTWVRPLMMGLEEHLLGMFREDFEFNESKAPSHLGQSTRTTRDAVAAADVAWQADAEQELRKIPFFVRGKARRNTERYARDQGIVQITVETLYDAKAHYSR